MSGTPWHVERVHRDENDDRRHKSNCKYYTKTKCLKFGFKCFGSAHCDDYKQKSFKESNQINPGKYTVIKRIPHGSFSVIYLNDDEVMNFVIGDNIKLETELVKQVIDHDIGDRLFINDEEIKILKKDIYYK